MSFFKWVGKKAKLWEQYKPYFPKKFDSYFEPFLGSGSIYFFLQPKGNVYLSDTNKELIAVFKTLKDSPDILFKELKLLREKQVEIGHYKTYYEVRDWQSSCDHEVAARFLYLNFCGFNGLYRLNSKGIFNVPIGRKADESYYDFEPDFDQLLNCHNIFNTNQLLEILCLDYAKALSYPSKNDFVYLDPPYDEQFAQYTAKGFGRYDQQKLANYCDEMTSKGILWAQSNSNTDWIRDRYADYNIYEMYRTGCMNSDPEKRQKVKELLINNYLV